MTSLPLSPTLLPRTLLNRWRLGCIQIACSLLMTFCSFLLWTLQNLNFNSTPIPVRFLLLAAILSGLWSIAEHLLWFIGIWLFSSPFPNAETKFLHVFLRTMVSINTVVLISFQAAMLWFGNREFEVAYPIFKCGTNLLFFTRAITVLALALWSAHLAHRLALSSYRWQCSLLSVLLPLAIILETIAFISAYPHRDPTGLLLHSIAAPAICILIGWSTILLFAFARTLHKLPTSHSSAFEVIAN